MSMSGSVTFHRATEVLRGGTLGALLVLVPATAALGQDAGEGASQIDEIVVTAQFRAQNLQDTPLAITAISAAMLEERGQENIVEIASQAPNVTLRETPATYGPAMAAYIRGVGQRDTTLALEPGVGIYVDDVYIPTLHGSMIELIDLDRVEILRGPQGTLAGQNSIGGAIKLYSARPDEERNGFVQGTYGSYHRIDLRAASNFTLVPERLYARLSGTSAQKNGFITRYDYACTHPGTTVPTFVVNTESCELGTEGGKSYVAGRLALRWLATDALSVDVIADVVEDDSEVGPTTLLYVGTAGATGGPGSGAGAAYSIGGVPFGEADGSAFISYSPYGNYAKDTFSRSPYISYETYIDPAPRNGAAAWAAPQQAALDTWGVSGRIEWRLGDAASLTSITAYREFDSLYSSSEGTPLSVTLQANRIYHHQFSQELRLNGQFGERLHYTLGGYYFDKSSENVSRITLPTLEWSEHNVVPSTTKAVFANVDFALTDKLNFVAGARYTDVSKTFHYGRLGIPGVAGGLPPASLAPLNGLVRTYADDRLDYRAVAQYRWNDALMTYLQVSTGFKGGGTNPRPFFPAQALTHNPESLDAYEFGFKSDFFSRRVRVNGAVFLNKYSDILMSVSSCPLPGVPSAPCALPINAGEADVKGLELEATVEPIAGLLIDASVATLDFEYQSISTAGAASGITLDKVGPYIMDWQWSAGAQYRIALGARGSLTPRIDANHDDGFFRDPSNNPFSHVDGRTLLNARLTYQSDEGDWQLALECKNLTDKLYYTDVFDNRGSTRSIQGRPGDPRTVALSVKHSF
jgi:iron complex outermembrane receptor protein